MVPADDLRATIVHKHGITASIYGTTVFSKMGLVRACHQIPVAAEDIEETAVMTPSGLLEFPRMPSGLHNSAQAFQKFVDSITRQLIYFASIDDLLITSSNADEHVQHSTRLFQILSNRQTVINFDKFELGRTKLSFLGQEITREVLKLP